MRASLSLLVACATLATAGTLPAQDAPSLPAAFYDIEVTTVLGFGSNRIGADAVSFDVVVPVGRRGPLAQPISDRVFRAGRFIVAADSLVFTRGSRQEAIAIGDLIRVETVAVPAANPAPWVKITYRAHGDITELYFRRTTTPNQELLVGALRAAMARAQAEATR